MFFSMPVLLLFLLLLLLLLFNDLIWAFRAQWRHSVSDPPTRGQVNATLEGFTRGQAARFMNGFHNTHTHTQTRNRPQPPPACISKTKINKSARREKGGRFSVCVFCTCLLPLFSD